jgi:hypothetical protein
MILETTEFIPLEVDRTLHGIFITDIDRDNDGDFFLGDLGGGIHFFRNVTGQAVKPPVYLHPLHGIELSFGPNPANPFLVARCKLQVAGFVKLGVYDVTGRLVAPLASEFLLPGSHQFRWDAANVASGVYLLRLETEKAEAVGKVVVLR